MCAHALARELRSSEILYGPDNFSSFSKALGVEEGVSLAEILSAARRECGVPTGSIREMADQDGEELNLDSSCYYVEAIDLEEQQ